jgi:hypothetical protein
MQDRRPTRRRQCRIRKRMIFAISFMAFSFLFYQSALTFKQDQVASAVMTAHQSVAALPAPTDLPRQNANMNTHTQGVTETPLQGPAAVSLAFRINSSPELSARMRRIQRREEINVVPETLPEIVN